MRELLANIVRTFSFLIVAAILAIGLLPQVTSAECTSCRDTLGCQVCTLRATMLDLETSSSGGERHQSPGDDPYEDNSITVSNPQEIDTDDDEEKKFAITVRWGKTQENGREVPFEMCFFAASASADTWTPEDPALERAKIKLNRSGVSGSFEYELVIGEGNRPKKVTITTDTDDQNNEIEVTRFIDRDGQVLEKREVDVSDNFLASITKGSRYFGFTQVSLPSDMTGTATKVAKKFSGNDTGATYIAKPDNLDVKWITEVTPPAVNGSKQIQTSLIGYDNNGRVAFKLSPAAVARFCANPNNNVTLPTPTVPLPENGLQDATYSDLASAATTTWEYDGDTDTVTKVEHECGSCGETLTTNYNYGNCPDVEQDQEDGFVIAPRPDTSLGENDYDANNTCLTYRRIFAPNKKRLVTEFYGQKGRLLCSIEQKISAGSPQVGDPNYITHYVYGVEGQLIEERTPRACREYDVTWENNADGNDYIVGVTQDSSLSGLDTVGMVRVFGRVEETSGRVLKYEKVRNKLDPTATHRTVSARIYAGANSSDDDPNEVGMIIESYEFPDEDDTTIWSASPTLSKGVKTEYERTFDDGRLVVEKTKYPAIDASQNGNGIQPEVWRHYRYAIDQGTNEVLLHWNDWTKHEDGSYSHTLVNADGQVVREVTDVDTSLLFDSDGSSIAVPSGWVSPRSGMHLETCYWYDDEGRMYRRRDADGSITYTRVCVVGKNRETRTYRGWLEDEESSKPLLGVSVSVTDANGLTLRTYSYTTDSPVMSIEAIDRYSVAGDMEVWVPDGTETPPASAYTSLNVYEYTNEQLDAVYSYHELNSVPDTVSDLATDVGAGRCVKTEYSYDTLGRRYKTTYRPYGTVSIVTVREYDWLNQIIVEKRGESEAEAVTVTKYDYSTERPRSSIATWSYLSSEMYTKQESRRDVRDRVSRTYDSVTGILRVHEYFPQKTIVREYMAEGIDDDVSGASPFAARTTEVDDRGRVFRTIVHKDGDVNSSETMVTKYWYDHSGRTVKVQGPGDVSYRKTGYTSTGDVLYQAVCTDEGVDKDVDDLDDDTIVELTAYSYDPNGHQIGVWQGTTLGDAADWEGPNKGGNGDMVCISQTWYDADQDHDITEQDWRPYVTASGTLKPMATPGTGDPVKSDFAITTYGYDNAGRLIEETTPDPDGAGSDVAVTTKTLFDFSRVTDVKVREAGVGGKLLSWQETSYTGPYTHKQITHEINAAGDGTTGNSIETEFAYDSMSRQYKVISPTGAYTQTHYNKWDFTIAVSRHQADGTVISMEATQLDADCREVARWVGTALGDANSPTKPNDGSGGDMVLISRTWYDEDRDGDQSEDDFSPHVTGVSVLKALDTAPTAASGSVPGDSSQYVLTEYEYDGYGRRYKTISPGPDGTDIATIQSWDDAGRPTLTKTFASGSPDVLLSQSEKVYNNYFLESKRIYKMDGDDSASTTYMEYQYDYDSLGRLVKTTQPSGLFTKVEYYDSGYQKFSALCNPVTGSDPNYIEHTVPTYDNVGQTTLVTTYKRTHDTNLHGPLDTDPWSNADSRRTFVAYWYDAVGRQIASADYGTNGGSSASPGDNPPARSDNVIVTTRTYNGFGQLDAVTDNMDRTTKRFYDDHGRLEYVVENYDASTCSDPGSPSARDTDVNRITKYVRDDVGRLTRQVAIDPDCDGSTSDNQATRYIYASELSSATIACPIPRPDLRVAVAYPDGENRTTVISSINNGNSGNFVAYTYYANGAKETSTDQRGVEHTYHYYDDGTLKADVITSFGSSGDVDDSVKAITYGYDSLARKTKVTSHDVATSDPDNTSVVNQVLYSYHTGIEWGLLHKSYQSHQGVVDTGSSPTVTYGYEEKGSGSIRYPRKESITYPSGRVVKYDYGTNESDTNALGSVAAITDATASTVFARYSYAGSGMVVKLEYPQVTDGEDTLNLSYEKASGDLATDPVYNGLDRFGRVTRTRWRFGEASSSSADTEDRDYFTYAYDRNSNRLYKKIELAAGASRSELYAVDGATQANAYDGLNRLREFQRGTITSSGSPVAYSVSNATSRQQFTLDGLGNWTGFNSGSESAWSLQQTREHNLANEIADTTSDGEGINEGGSDPVWTEPAHDEAGNMTAAPRPNAESDAAEGLLLVYDAWNRLTKAYGDADEDGIPEDGEEVGLYEYDGLHRRTRRQDKHSFGVDKDYHFYYDTRWRVLEVRDAVASNIAYKQFVWGVRYIDSPICRFRDGDPAADPAVAPDGTVDETLYYLNDGNFNVTALIETNGTVAERYVYDPYGRVTCLEGDWSGDSDGMDTVNGSADDGITSEFCNNILYCGYRYAPETGLYHVRFRYHHPTLGRWISQDPAGYVDGLNLYEYCGSSPLRGRDPYGLEDFSNVKGEKTRDGWLDYAKKVIIPALKKEKGDSKESTKGWIEHVKKKIADKLCSKDCMSPGPKGGKEACERQAEKVARQYVELFFKTAYGKKTTSYYEASENEPETYIWWKSNRNIRAGLRCYNWMIVTWHAVRQFDKDRVDSKEAFFIAQRAGTWKGNRLAHNYVVLRSGCGKSREYSDECSVRLDPWLKGKPEVFNSSKAHDGFEWNWITDRVGFSNLDAKALKGEVQPKMEVSGRLRTVGRDGKPQVVKKDHLGKADRKNRVPWKVVLPEEVRSEERVRQILRSTDWKKFDKKLDKYPSDIQDLILDRDPDLKRAYERRKEGMDRNGKK